MEGQIAGQRWRRPAAGSRHDRQAQQGGPRPGAEDEHGLMVAERISLPPSPRGKGEAVQRGGYCPSITPQAMRSPEAPVGCVLQSSSLAWRITDLPVIWWAASVRLI